MPDHYRMLIGSLRQLGFLFIRLGERKQEVWRNRQTDQEVMFDRREVSASKDVTEAVVRRARVAKPGVRVGATTAAALSVHATEAPAKTSTKTSTKMRAASVKKAGTRRGRRKAGAKAGPPRRSR